MRKGKRVTGEKGKRDDLTQSLQQLAELHGLTHEDGRLNYTAFGRRVGLPAPTIMRWHKGITKDVSSKAAQLICRAFNISEAQVRGLEPITPLLNKRNSERKPDQRDVQLIAQLRSLPVREQKEVERFVDIRLKMLRQ